MLSNYKKHLILSGISIRHALSQLTTLGIDAILFVVNEYDQLIGSITDGDVRRGLIKGISIDDTIDTILREDPKFILKTESDIQKIIRYREDNFRIIPVLDHNKKIVNIINFRILRSYLPLDAIIMAGGRGQRLSPLTDNIPKPLLKVGNKPIIEYNIDRLTYYGIDDYWISVNYLGEMIIDVYKNGEQKNINIDYVKESKPLGTIGSITLIENFKHENILLTNSDIITNIDYEKFYLEFLKNDADMAVATIPYQVNVPYAVLETSGSDILNFKEKPTYTYYSNGGIYLIKRSVLSYIPKNTFFNATDLLEILIKSKKKVFSYPLVGYWLDIGRPDDFERAQTEIYNIKF